MLCSLYLLTNGKFNTHMRIIISETLDDIATVWSLVLLVMLLLVSPFFHVSPTGCSLNIVFFPRILECLPPLPRQQRLAAIDCTKIPSQ